MSSMNITKSKFMEYIRCNRYAALNNIYKRKDMDDAAKDRFYDIIYSLEEFEFDGDENFLDPDLTHLEVMMPYFTKVEVLAARKIMSEWGGETRYGTEYGTQKLFLRDHKNFNLMCYVDIYNKQESQVNIIEVKATTTNKFMSLGYTKDKIRQSIFYKDDWGILRLKEELFPELLEDKQYLKQRQKLFNRLGSEGVYVFDLAFQRYVIEEDIKDAKYYLGVLNHEYVFDGQYIDGEPLYSNDIITFIDLTTITKEMQNTIENAIDQVVERILNDDEKRVPIGKHCQVKKMRQCIYKDLCFDQFPKSNSTMMYIDKHHGFKDESGNKYEFYELANDGYLKMIDIPHEWLTRRNNQIQRDVALSGKTYIDETKIKSALDIIKYPIYHLDFESFPCPLPRFKGEKAYTQSLFQFSLHIEREPGVCDKETDHYEFLASDHKDNRLELVQMLCEYIKDDGGSVMVYNEVFERTRIKELAGFFPEYAEKLHNINTRLFDLYHVVKTNSKLFEALGFESDRAKTVNYYHEKLDGSYSIKKVLPLFSDLTYKGMEVSNGMEAVYAYAGYGTLNESELDITRSALKEYCKQDTWAMVEILEELRKI